MHANSNYLNQTDLSLFQPIIDHPITVGAGVVVLGGAMAYCAMHSIAYTAAAVAIFAISCFCVMYLSWTAKIRNLPLFAAVECASVPVQINDLIRRTDKLLADVKNPYEMPFEPIGIVNEGKTCYAAAFMQIVCMNTILSGAFKAFLPDGHCARTIAEAYQRLQAEAAQKQRGPSMPLQGIMQIREFNDPRDEAIGGDAAQLGFQLFGQMKFPQDGAVNLGNNQQATFAHFRQKVIPSNNKAEASADSLKPDSNVPRSDVSFPLSALPVEDGDPTDLTTLLIKNREALCFSSNPDVMMLSLCRGKTSVTVDLPLLFKIPLENKADEALHSDEVYTLQGFLTHIDGGNVGHYIAYHQWHGNFYKADDHRVTMISKTEYLIAASLSSLPLYTKVTIKGG